MSQQKIYSKIWKFNVRNLIQGKQFVRDVKLCKKRGKDMSKLRDLMALLIAGNSLPPRYKDHPLKGDWNHHRDSHIEPDWLLIYKLQDNDLYFVRTGTHADIFGI